MKAANSLRGEEERCVNVLEALRSFPPHIAAMLEKLDEIFALSLEGTRWKDTNRWIESWASPYGERVKRLSKIVGETWDQLGSINVLMSEWNGRLRSLADPATWRGRLPGRVLCAFSSAVDATYVLDSEASLQRLLEHAAKFSRAGRQDLHGTEDLLNESFQAYGDKREEASWVATVPGAVAEIMYAYKHPEGSLKPTLREDAREWIRKLCLDFGKSEAGISTSGGGASLNIADALGGIGVPTDVYWPYHPELLARQRLHCTGADDSGLQRAEFDTRWKWRRKRFSNPAVDHPVRLSVILSFSPESPPIGSQILPDAVEPKGSGRLIFQFPDYMSAEYFSTPEGAPEKWPKRNCFCRVEKRGKEVRLFSARNTGMKEVKKQAYHRVILSGFQRDEASARDLGRQCGGLRVHHEISATFDRPEVVKSYCEILNTVLSRAAARSAGINEEELAAFTSWQSTDIFSAAQAEVKDSLLQRLFRAIRVREYFKLDWLYVHGNDIDIAVVNRDILPRDKGRQFLEQIRDAMLIAKVTVFAALHVRSGIETPEERFGPSCSPKGFLALFQFAAAFARQYAPADKRTDVQKQNIKDLQSQILMHGIVDSRPDAPIIVTVPVYWPDPAEGCAMTGAGDICSGVTAALAP